MLLLFGHVRVYANIVNYCRMQKKHILQYMLAILDKNFTSLKVHSFIFQPASPIQFLFEKNSENTILFQFLILNILAKTSK